MPNLVKYDANGNEYSSTGVASTRSISTGTGLTGGGDLSIDRTHSLVVPVSLTNGGLGLDSSGIAKGGQFTGTGAGTVGITVVGTDGKVWTADAASAGGAKWATVTGGGGTPYYGNGADGTVTISADTTLTADKQYANLTINAGKVLTTAGYVIFVTGTLTNNGTIDNSGANGSQATATLNGAAAAGGAGASLGAGGTSRGGGTTTFNNSQGESGLLGGVGGAGGTSPSANNGAASVVSSFSKIVLLNPWSTIVNAATSGQMVNEWVWVNNSNLVSPGSPFRGGGAGGHGAWGGWFQSSGGGGGGVVMIVASAVSGSGTISAIGGNGGSANASSSNSGGGGGGGGGAVILITGSASHSMTLTLTGGTGAAGNGTGVAGANGSTGTSFVFTGV